MSRTVFCRKFQTELEGLSHAPLPGKLGEDIYNNVSQKAWQQWLELQTRLINEKQLSMMDAEARKYLSEQREKFLSGQDYEEAEGYVPPKQH